MIDLRIWGITDAPNWETIDGPGRHGPLLDFATELDLVNGGVVRQVQIGNASNGNPVYAEAGIADGGDTFWVVTDTPNHFQNANRDYIGSEAQVVIYQSYTKDTDNASLTYTYSRAEVGAFMSVETGPQCQLGEPFCLRAGMISLVELYDAAGSAIGADFNKALMWSNGSPLWNSTVDGVTAWPWEIEESGVGGFLEYIVRLSQPVTNEVNLSDVALGQEFTVVYTLYAYALDTSADAGLFRAAEAFARDPLGGNTGVRFDLAGLTPTNNPSVRPVPEAATALMLLSGSAILAAAARRPRAAARATHSPMTTRARTPSRRRPVHGHVVACCLAGLALLATSPAHATILMFDQERDAAGQTTVQPTSSGGRLPGDYGDNVTAALMAVPGGFFTYGDGGEGFTPNISLEIYGDGGPSNPRVNLWQTGYGDLVNVIFGKGPGTAGSPTLNVLFTAEPGFVVDLYGFDLAGFGSDYTIAGVEVLAGVTTLFSASAVLVQGDLNGPGRTTFGFATPLSAPKLLLRIDLSNLAAGIQDNIGFDNVRFGQTPPPVPEPATGVLLLAGLAALGLGRRTHRAARQR